MGRDFSQVGTVLESFQKHLATGTIYHEGHLNSFAGILVRFRGTHFSTLSFILLEYFMSTPYLLCLTLSNSPRYNDTANQPPFPAS